MPDPTALTGEPTLEERVVTLEPGELIDDMPELGAVSTFRGYPIRWDDEGWRYVDTGELIYGTWESRPCGHCLRYPTPEGHDPCLGTLPGVRNACCGHGDAAQSYVQFDNGAELRGFVTPAARPTEGSADQRAASLAAPEHESC